MPHAPTRQNSAKIAEVLQVVHNPRVPAAAKQQTLRRLDGLEGRSMKRSSQERERERESIEGRRRSEDDDEDDGREARGVARCRRANSDSFRGVYSCLFESVFHFAKSAMLVGERPRPINPERRGTHLDQPTRGTRHVNFMDEWEHNARVLAEPKAILHGEQVSFSRVFYKY